MADFDKQDERRHLDLFLAARKSATGEALTVVEETEAPDFICKRPDGSLVGIEHTKVAYNLEARECAFSNDEWDDEIDDWEILWSSYNALVKKEAKRKKAHWKLPGATILVFDLVDGNGMQEWPDEDDDFDDFDDAGFIEVWIFDHASLEAYGTVTAIGLFPKSIRGVRGQGHLSGPPYK